jgi:myosin heavy subunit
VFDWFVTAVNFIDKMNDDILKVLVGFLLIVSTLFLWLWFSNRRKYHNLKHAIPANVVKNYLDSIIQNSTALKSQLFRGGGIDVSNIPSVLPLQNLMGGDGIAISGAPSTALMEELNQKRAQIAALEAQLNPLQLSNKELDNKLGKSQNNLTTAEKKIKELEALLSQSHEGGSADAALSSELKSVTKERNELLEKLKEFEIIADDLANLKRLQQENEQLKKSLAAQGGSAPIAPAMPAEPSPVSQNDVDSLFEDLGNTAPQSDSNQALEEFLTSPTDSSVDELPNFDEPLLEESNQESAEEPIEVAQAASPVADESKKNDKTPEDLLSEFEKMLG